MNTYKTYWQLYGGFPALVRSPYVYAALALTALCFPYWNKQDVNGTYPWADTAIAIIPNLLGFSMGGMAVMLAFSGASFFKIIAEDGQKNSLFAQVIANFFHFVLVQGLTVSFALLVLAHPNSILSCFGFLFLTYSVMVAVATAGQLLNIGVILNKTASLPEVGQDKNAK